MRLERKRAARILDFDVECRPLAWYGGDFVSKEVTAIAWAWVSPTDPSKPAPGGVSVVLLGDMEPAEMFALFRAAYDEADIVTGHFIRGFDLPMLNAMAFGLGEPPLRPTLVQDTKTDLVHIHGLSKSQENLGALLGLKHPKVNMTQADWRAANRLESDGLTRTLKRVKGDVRQHIELRAALMKQGMLGPPRPWTGKGRSSETYQP